MAETGPLPSAAVWKTSSPTAIFVIASACISECVVGSPSSLWRRRLTIRKSSRSNGAR